MMRLPISVLLLCLVAGCLQKSNPYYCGNRNPDNNCQEPLVHSCAMSMDCPTDVPVCDSVAKICVQCTASEQAACHDDTPICRADEHCHPCSFHDECPSKVCLPTGGCAKAADVAYVVSPNGNDNATCAMNMQCATIMAAVQTPQPYIKLRGSFDEVVTITNNRKVTILVDPGAVLTHNGGNILVIDGNSEVQIYDLAITGASDMGAGISLPSGSSQKLTLEHVSISGNNGRGGAITVSGGTIIIHRSMISDNRGGGISVSMAEFDIENNFIVGNGYDQATTGGISFDKINNGIRIVAFNTISANQSTATPGISCSNNVVLIAPFSNNIVYNNGMIGARQVDLDHCASTYSDISGPGITATNISVSPSFANAGDFHLKAGSPLIDAADPSPLNTPGVDVDIDGDIRPQGKSRDIGADEYKAP
jgi:hypothetical protein